MEVSSPTAKPRVFVLDDEPMVGELLSRVLGDRMDVVTERHAPDGLAALLAGDPFDLVLCDLAMPVMSGQDLFERLEDERPELARRMMFITGGAFDDEVVEFLDAVENPVLHKPFSSEELRTAVDGALQKLGFASRSQ